MKNINYDLLDQRIRQSGYTYIELAEIVEISRNTIHNTIFGRTKPSYEVTTGLAEALNLTQDEIIAIFFPNYKLKKELKHDKYPN